MKSVFMIAFMIVVFLGTSSTAFFKYVSRYEGEFYESKISVNKLAQMPEWDCENNDIPPLPPGRALALANEMIANVFPERNWLLSSINLTPIRRNETVMWVYYVRYMPKIEMEIDERYTHDTFSIIVLMNGECIRPAIRELHEKKELP